MHFLTFFLIEINKKLQKTHLFLFAVDLSVWPSFTPKISRFVADKSLRSWKLERSSCWEIIHWKAVSWYLDSITAAGEISIAAASLWATRGDKARGKSNDLNFGHLHFILSTWRSDRPFSSTIKRWLVKSGLVRDLGGVSCFNTKTRLIRDSVHISSSVKTHLERSESRIKVDVEDVRKWVLYPWTLWVTITWEFIRRKVEGGLNKKYL